MMQIKKININFFKILKYLNGTNNVGVELGVAEGGYSFNVMKSGKFKNFYG